MRNRPNWLEELSFPIAGGFISAVGGIQSAKTERALATCIPWWLNLRVETVAEVAKTHGDFLRCIARRFGVNREILMPVLKNIFLPLARVS